MFGKRPILTWLNWAFARLKKYVAVMLLYKDHLQSIVFRLTIENGYCKSNFTILY
jgi:hypothetical protein